MKKVLLTTIFAVIMIGSSLFYSSCNKEEGLVESFANEQPEAMSGQTQYPTQGQVINVLTSQGYTLEPVPTWYSSGSSSPTVLCYSNGDDYMFLRVYDSQQDAEEDEWSTTCPQKWHGTGTKMGQCDDPGDQCKVVVIHTPTNYTYGEIICCD